MSLILNPSVSTQENNVIINPNVHVYDQTQPYPGASDQYSVITTRNILNILTDMGFTYEALWEQRYQTNSVRKGFGKHALRVRHAKLNFGNLRRGLVPQFYLWNSYDRTMRFKFIGGMFDTVYNTEYSWGTHFFEPLKVIHRNVDYNQLQKDIDDAVLRLNNTNQIILDLENTMLTNEQKYEYAKRMAHVRLGNSSKVTSIKNFRELVDQVRRDDLKVDSAWNIASRVQENLLSTSGNAVSLTYSAKKKVTDTVSVVKSTNIVKSAWVRNTINMALFDVMKSVIEGASDQTKLEAA